MTLPIPLNPTVKISKIDVNDVIGGSYTMKNLYTIGHSIHEIDNFITLLKKNHIDTIVDVRSTPYSKFASQFNRETFKDALKERQIYYLFMGDLLGARYEDEGLLFDSGKVNFKKVQKTSPFENGIHRLNQGITKGYTIALMCSEKEAFDCHRFGLISEYIHRHFHDITIKHIYPDKILSQTALERQLIKKYHPYIDYLGLETKQSPLEQAYAFRNKEIAYHAITQKSNM